MEKKQDTTNAVNRAYLVRDCAVSYTLGLLEGRWKAPLIIKISRGISRFGKLKESLPGISEKMLAKQLKELEADALIVRMIYPEIPPRTEYTLTQKGRELESLLQQFCEWGAQYMPEVSPVTTMNN